MSVSQAFNLTKANKESSANKVLVRQQRLLAKLEEQEELLKAEQENREHTITKQRYETDGDGNKVLVEKKKQVSKWYWFDGKTWLFHLRYGVKVMELSKGRNAIVVKQKEDLFNVIDKVKELIVKGELDDIMDKATTKD